MAYFFASPIDVDIKLEGDEVRKQVEIKSEKDKNIACPVYYDGDSVTGQVRFFSLERCIRSSLRMNLNPR
jgi:vacuolar protein sorting-associated protein 26